MLTRRRVFWYTVAVVTAVAIGLLLSIARGPLLTLLASTPTVYNDDALAWKLIISSDTPDDYELVASLALDRADRPGLWGAWLVDAERPQSATADISSTAVMSQLVRSGCARSAAAVNMLNPRSTHFRPQLRAELAVLAAESPNSTEFAKKLAVQSQSEHVPPEIRDMLRCMADRISQSKDGHD